MSDKKTDKVSNKKEKIRIDLVVPCYNENENIKTFYDAANEVEADMDDVEFSYIFVDDGGTDGTIKAVKDLTEEKKGQSLIRYISFSRNFGKEAAIYAGLKASAEGMKDEKPADYTVLIDADLQHPPQLIPEMLQKVKETDADACAVRRVSRKGEPKIRSSFSRLFYKLMNKFCDIEIVDGAMDFRIMSRRMVKAVVDLPETQRFSKGIFAWVGFDTEWLEMENVERVAGETSWSAWKLFKYSIAGLLDFAEAPLKITGVLGGIVSVLAVIYLIAELIKTAVVGKDLPGYESLISLILIFGGVIIALLSVIGEYIGRMYLEIKNRPIFIEKERGDNR